MRTSSRAGTPLPPPRLAIPRGAGLLLISLVFLAGCGPRQIADDTGPQAYYRTGLPLHDTSRELEAVTRSLKQILFTAEYVTFVFPLDAGIREMDLDDPAVLERAVERYSDTDTKRGTAVVLARTDERAALITNNHVVGFPDRLIRFFDEEGARMPRAARRVASVSIRTHELGVIADHANLGPFEVLVRDTINDIAILEVSFSGRAGAEDFPPLPVDVGDPRRLSWGSFVYVVGYPLGFPMVTRAVVSDPNRTRDGGFLTDGLWNEGISGGAILGVRGETGRLEWVGMTRAAAGAWEVSLQPRGDEAMDDPDLALLYTGPLFLESNLRVQYGVTHPLSINLLRSFISRNRGLLRGRGFDVRAY